MQNPDKGKDTNTVRFAHESILVHRIEKPGIIKYISSTQDVSLDKILVACISRYFYTV